MRREWRDPGSVWKDRFCFWATHTQPVQWQFTHDQNRSLYNPLYVTHWYEHLSGASKGAVQKMKPFVCRLEAKYIVICAEVWVWASLSPCPISEPWTVNCTWLFRTRSAAADGSSCSLSVLSASNNLSIILCWRMEKNDAKQYLSILQQVNFSKLFSSSVLRSTQRELQRSEQEEPHWSTLQRIFPEETFSAKVSQY